MHDPFAWSFPMGRLFGVTIRIHILFPVVALGWILHVANYKSAEGWSFPPGAWIDASVLMLLLFFSTLFHEFGHIFAARASGGDGQEVLLWPLGGLANVEVPHRPGAHLITAAAGPAVNLLLCFAAVIGLLLIGDNIQPIWNPLPGGYPYRNSVGVVPLTTWSGEAVSLDPMNLSVWMVRIFWINWFLGLLNLILVGFPLDGGRILQAALWPSLGYRQAMLTAVFAGFGVVLVVGLYSIIISSPLAMALALLIYTACQRQWIILETGGEEGVFGYDFSQGYTSLEKDHVQAAPPKPKVSWWRRWMQRRAAKRIQRETEQRIAEERRMDELLDKVHRQGRGALTDEEERFMKRVSDRYRKQGGQ